MIKSGLCILSLNATEATLSARCIGRLRNISLSHPKVIASEPLRHGVACYQATRREPLWLLCDKVLISVIYKVIHFSTEGRKYQDYHANMAALKYRSCAKNTVTR